MLPGRTCVATDHSSAFLVLIVLTADATDELILALFVAVFLVFRLSFAFFALGSRRFGFFVRKLLVLTLARSARSSWFVCYTPLVIHTNNI